MDSAVRNALMTEYTHIVQEVQNKIGEEIGADAIEVSAHAHAAEDHEPIQGRIFTLEEWEKLQNGESAREVDYEKYERGEADYLGDTFQTDRPIGQWNCRHIAYNFLLGISEPSFSKEALDRLQKQNEKGVTFHGKQYTLYEAEQEQRRLETAMRHERERLNLLKEVKDTDPALMRDYQKSRERLAELRGEYKELGAVLEPKAIRMKMERSYVPKGSTGEFGMPSDNAGNQGRGKYEKQHISPEVDALSVDKKYTELEKRVIMTESMGGIVKEKGMEITKGEPMLITKASEGTNPNYDPAKKDIVDPYNVNCQRCVIAYIMRRLGFDVEAMPFPKENEPNQVRSGLECFKRPNGADAFQSPEMSKTKLLGEMQQAPDGTLFLVNGKEPGALQGHIWVAEKINGKLYFIDPQSNETDVSRYLSIYKGLRYTRADIFVFNSSPDFNWNSVIKGAGK